MISLIDNCKFKDDVKEAPDMSFDDGFVIRVKNGSVNPSSKDISIFILYFSFSNNPSVFPTPRWRGGEDPLQLHAAEGNQTSMSQVHSL